MSNFSEKLVLSLVYQHNKVGVKIEDNEKEIYSKQYSCNLSSKDQYKVNGLKEAVLFLSSKGFNGHLTVKLTDKSIEKWVRGVSVPSDRLVSAVYKLQSVIDSALFSIEFNQKTRLFNKESEKVQEEKIDLVDFMKNLEDEGEDE